MRWSKPFFLLSFLAFLLGNFSCYYDNREDLLQYVNTACDTSVVSYQNDIVPLLESQCLSCHSQGNALGGNIFLANYDQVKTKADDGSFYGSVSHTGGFTPMPPTGQKISDCVIHRIKSWIDLGAPNN